jgi:ABC-type Fe3+/spermidine/putrescine transport system ATPase subunit
MRIELIDVHAAYGTQPALRGVSLAIEGGQVLALLGPSGSGKTTLLAGIAGLRPLTGQLLLDGAPSLALPPRARKAGMVFQDLALWPHLTVAGHLQFVLKGSQVPAAEHAARTRQTLEQLELLPLSSRRPDQLSGGERQRLALARALVAGPRILLLDEPLGALDRRLRDHMLELLRELQQRLRPTTVLVTHDYDEALALADQVAVLHAGRLLQTGAPDLVYHRPVSARVAKLCGPVSLVRAERKGSRVCCAFGEWPAEFAGCTAATAVRLVLRPGAVRIVAGDAGTVMACRFHQGRWEAEVARGDARVWGVAETRLVPGSHAGVSVSTPVWAVADET